MVSSLESVHRNGVIHADIKPKNFIIHLHNQNTEKQDQQLDTNAVLQAIHENRFYVKM